MIKVKAGIFDSVIKGLGESDFTGKICEKIKSENFLIFDYLLKVREAYGEQAALTGLLVYKFLDSQHEADSLERLIG